MVTNQMLPATEGDDTVKAITSFLFILLEGGAIAKVIAGVFSPLSSKTHSCR